MKDKQKSHLVLAEYAFYQKHISKSRILTVNFHPCTRKNNPKTNKQQQMHIKTEKEIMPSTYKTE